jgi:hypothetical protein
MIIIKVYLFAPRVPTKLNNIHRPPLTDQKPNSNHANTATTKLKTHIAREALNATRPALFSEDVSIELEEGDEDGREDGTFGVA